MGTRVNEMRSAGLLALVALMMVGLGGCDLPKGDKTSPDYWSDLYLDMYADKLVVGPLEPGPGALPHPRAVLLITGVTIRTQWFDPIVARLQRDGFTPIVWEPPELLSYDLFQASEDLAAVVQKVLASTGQKHLDILAECTGGVIARYYLQSLGGDQHVSRLVTFVSPHNGIAKAPWAALIAGWPALYDLSPGSAFLEAVNGQPLPANVPVTSIYTCSDEYIQPWKTSLIPGANNIGLCDGKVGHFQTFYDPAIYALMHTALTQPSPNAEPEPSPAVEPPAPSVTDPVAAPVVPNAPVEAAPVSTPATPVASAAVAPDAPIPGSTDLGSSASPAAPVTVLTLPSPGAGRGCTTGRGQEPATGVAWVGALGLALLAVRRRGGARIPS